MEASIDLVRLQLYSFLRNFVAAHSGQTTGQGLRWAWGLLDMAVQDRELVDIRGGYATFENLRITYDATEPEHAVNLRVFKQQTAGSYDIVYPFTDNGLPQVLTAQGSTMTYAQAANTGQYLLWSPGAGVHWGELSTGSPAPSRYVFGTSNLVVGTAFGGSYPDIPQPKTIYLSLAALMADHGPGNVAGPTKFMGDVNVWFRTNMSGPPLQLDVSPPYYMRVIPSGLTGGGVANDTLTVNSSRLEFQTVDPYSGLGRPFGRMFLTAVNCHWSPDTYIVADNLGEDTPGGGGSDCIVDAQFCTGYITMANTPLFNVTELRISDSDMKLEYIGLDLEPLVQTRHFQVQIEDSRVSVAHEGVTGRGSLLDYQFDSLVVNSSVSVDVPAGAAASATHIADNSGSPAHWTITASDVSIPSVVWNKWVWNSGLYGQSEAVFDLVSSTLHIRDVLGVASTNVNVEGPTWGPLGLSNTSYLLVAGSAGSRTFIGDQREVGLAAPVRGLYLDFSDLVVEYPAANVLLGTKDTDGLMFSTIVTNTVDASGLPAMINVAGTEVYRSTTGALP